MMEEAVLFPHLKSYKIASKTDKKKSTFAIKFSLNEIKLFISSYEPLLVAAHRIYLCFIVVFVLFNWFCKKRQREVLWLRCHVRTFFNQQV